MTIRFNHFADTAARGILTSESEAVDNKHRYTGVEEEDCGCATGMAGPEKNDNPDAIRFTINA
jgi:hypothetical protein